MDSMNMNNRQDSVSPESPAKKSPSSHYPGTKDGYTLLSKSYMASLISCAVSAVCTILYLCYFFINPEAGELSDDVSNAVGFILFSFSYGMINSLISLICFVLTIGFMLSGLKLCKSENYSYQKLMILYFVYILSTFVTYVLPVVFPRATMPKSVERLFPFISFAFIMLLLRETGKLAKLLALTDVNKQINNTATGYVVIFVVVFLCTLSSRFIPAGGDKLTLIELIISFITLFCPVIYNLLLFRMCRKMSEALPE